MIKPNTLKKGDTIAILSPSWGGPSLFPHIYESGLNHLKELGFKIKEYPTARMEARKTYENPEIRAKDINDAFADPDVQAIIATIGGTDSARILKYLDLDIIKANPKFFMGYSDTTTINSWLNYNGLVTFNGPSIMAGFSQFGAFPSEYRKYVEDFFFSHPGEAVQPFFRTYSEGYPSWGEKDNRGKLKKLNESDGPHFIQGSGSVSGPLFGGCFEVLEMLKGTDFWPTKDFWKGKILFFETSEEKPSTDYVHYWLRNYGVMGVFDRIAGILIGRARDYSAEEKEKLEQTVLTVVKDEFGHQELPVVTNMDFGHTDPQLILPLGVKFEIDCENKRIKRLESAFF